MEKATVTLLRITCRGEEFSLDTPLVQERPEAPCPPGACEPPSATRLSPCRNQLSDPDHRRGEKTQCSDHVSGQSVLSWPSSWRRAWAPSSNTGLWSMQHPRSPSPRPPIRLHPVVRPLFLCAAPSPRPIKMAQAIALSSTFQRQATLVSAPRRSAGLACPGPCPS